MRKIFISFKILSSIKQMSTTVSFFKGLKTEGKGAVEHHSVISYIEKFGSRSISEPILKVCITRYNLTSNFSSFGKGKKYSQNNEGYVCCKS